MAMEERIGCPPRLRSSSLEVFFPIFDTFFCYCKCYLTTHFVASTIPVICRFSSREPNILHLRWPFDIGLAQFLFIL